MSKDEVNDTVDKRDCGKCVWRAELGCSVWSCDYLSRSELHKILEENPQLRRKQ